MIHSILPIRLSHLAMVALAAMAVPVMTGCNDLDNDDHYSESSTAIDNPELKIVSQSSEDYIKSRSDVSSMHQLFVDNGIYDELKTKNQLSTILLVTNDNYVAPTGDADEIRTATRSHISDASVSPANLHNGDRLMMWHNKYVNISMDELGQEGQIVDHISFNNGVVQEVVQTTNGYIYVISDMIVTPTSLSDFINSLDDNYSIFRELVLSSGGKEFDRANSKPIGVNEEGNTVYDSVFIYTNEHFDNVNFDLNSESLTATMLLPDDNVIRAAMDDAHARLAAWDMERDDKVLLNWIMDVAFFNRRHSVETLTDKEHDDINSVFSKQWRPSAHEIDPSETIELSNGVVHKVKKIHIPNNVLMYRLKDWFYFYESCTDQQKLDYFAMNNMVFSKCEVGVASWTPLEGVWPPIEDRVLILAPGDDGQGSNFHLDFTPVRLKTDENGLTQVVPYLIPPGTYRLAFGSKQNQNLDIKVTVFVAGQPVATSEVITLGSATTYHYDRGTILPNRYPEGYDPSVVTAMGGSSKASNYSTDGGLLIDEVTIPDVKGDGSASQIVIRIEGDSWKEQTGFTLCHWCLRPTVNNY